MRRLLRLVCLLLPLLGAAPASAADPHLEPGFPVKALFNAGGYGGGSAAAAGAAPSSGTSSR